MNKTMRDAITEKINAKAASTVEDIIDTTTPGVEIVPKEIVSYEDVKDLKGYLLPTSCVLSDGTLADVIAQRIEEDLAIQTDKGIFVLDTVQAYNLTGFVMYGGLVIYSAKSAAEVERKLEVLKDLRKKIENEQFEISFTNAIDMIYKIEEMLYQSLFKEESARKWGYSLDDMKDHAGSIMSGKEPALAVLRRVEYTEQRLQEYLTYMKLKGL